jgi:hypothetical protein
MANAHIMAPIMEFNKKALKNELALKLLVKGNIYILYNNNKIK